MKTTEDKGDCHETKSASIQYQEKKRREARGKMKVLTDYIINLDELVAKCQISPLS